MSLAGTAAVAIWHDVAPQGRDEFYAWHGREHMPERVAVPGFVRGRRYVAVDADLEYFNLYEARDLAVLTGPDYQERLDNPTPWTLSTVRHFRRVARSLCRVSTSLGPGQGGLISTWRYDVAAANSAEHVKALTTDVLPELAGQAMVAGAHLLIADTPASAVDSVERETRGEENRIPPWIIMLEGWGDEAPFARLCAEMLSDRRLRSAGATGPAAVGLYRLQATATRV